MKNSIKLILQKILGYHNYLFLFALYVTYTLRFQKKEKDFLYFLELLPNNKSVLDIGANIGVMSYYLSKKLPQNKVFAFEPQPDNLKTLERVIRFFKLNNVVVFDFALGNQKGQVEMVLPIDGNTKLHGLSHVCHESIEDFNEGEKFTVLVNALDSIETIKSTSIGGIKLDVENFEFFVLEGAKQLLENQKPIVYTELWDNQNRVNCIKFMSDLGYDCKNFIHNNLVDYQPGITKSQNFFFIPQI